MLHPRYRLQQKLGDGATSEVFLAEVSGEMGFSPRVAVKRLRLDAQDSLQVERFVDEATITSHLRHPNVVSILDFGLLDGTPFSVLELVEGHSAAELMTLAGARGERLPPQVALHITHEIAIALDYVHRAEAPDGARLRIVHRDISPDNLLVARTGHVKLADFSVARALHRRAKTQAGQARGTLAYMAPEQLRFELLTPRTDLFALGCVLHALLTGRSPLEDEAAREALVAGEEPALDPTLDPELSRIVARAVRARPSERFENARALAEACWRALTPALERDARLYTADWLATFEAPPPPTDERPPTQEIRLRTSSDGIKIFTLSDVPVEEGPTRLIEQDTLLERPLPQLGAIDVPPVSGSAETRIFVEPSPRRPPALLTALLGVAVGALAGLAITHLREDIPEVRANLEPDAPRPDVLWGYVDRARAMLARLPVESREPFEARLAPLKARLVKRPDAEARRRLQAELQALEAELVNAVN